VGGNQGVVHIGGIRRGVTDTLNPLDLGDLGDQTPQPPFATTRGLTVKAIDVLA